MSTISQYQIFKDEGGQWRWRLLGRNLEPVATSEAYTRRSTAIKMAKRMPEIAATDVISQLF